MSFTNLTTGLGNTNFPVTLSVVANNPVLLHGIRALNNGMIAVTLQGNTGRVYAIVMSSNVINQLTNWTEWVRVTNTTGQTTFTNPPPTNTPRGFFRALEF